MPTITFQDRKIDLRPGETVLDALLREGHDVPFSCKSGSCQSCMMKSNSGDPPASSQKGLRESLAMQNYFLSCTAKPEGDLQVCLPDADSVSIPAVVSEIVKLSDDVVKVVLTVESEIEFAAGQYISVVRDDGLIRSYSVASLPSALPQVELHVRRVPEGQMSCWFYDGSALNQRIHVRGPAGDCMYMPQHPEEELLLVGTGTGLAPLYGIAKDAIEHGHKGKISLYHGGLNPSRLYFVDTLYQLASEADNLDYFPCVLNGDDIDSQLVGSIDEVVMQRHPKMDGYRVYLCGNPDFVKKMRKKVFLAGVHSKKIHADAFLTAGTSG